MHILCAGTDGDITREDVLFAGAIVEMLCKLVTEKIEINDQARIARAAWRQVIGAFDLHDPAAIEHLAKNLRHTHGGHNLITLGNGTRYC